MQNYLCKGRKFKKMTRYFRNLGRDVILEKMMNSKMKKILQDDILSNILNRHICKKQRCLPIKAQGAKNTFKILLQTENVFKRSSRIIVRQRHLKSILLIDNLFIMNTVAKKIEGIVLLAKIIQQFEIIVDPAQIRRF